VEKNIEELLWYVPGTWASRPRKYRAPSWSWASIDGHVHQSAVNKTQRIEITDTEARITPSGSAEFGGIKDGIIHVRCPPLKSAQICLQSGEDNDDGQYWRRWILKFKHASLPFEFPRLDIEPLDGPSTVV